MERGHSQCRTAVDSRSQLRLGLRYPGSTCTCISNGRAGRLVSKIAHCIPNLRPLNRLGSLSTTCSLFNKPLEGAMTHPPEIELRRGEWVRLLRDPCSRRIDRVVGKSHWLEDPGFVSGALIRLRCDGGRRVLGAGTGKVRFEEGKNLTFGNMTRMTVSDKIRNYAFLKNARKRTWVGDGIGGAELWLPDLDGTSF